MSNPVMPLFGSPEPDETQLPECHGDCDQCLKLEQLVPICNKLVSLLSPELETSNGEEIKEAIRALAKALSP